MKHTLSPFAFAGIVGAMAGTLSSAIVGLVGYVVVKDRLSDAPPTTVTQVYDVVGDDSVVNVAAQAGPSVVSIIATKDMPTYEQFYRNYGWFQFPEYRESGTERREIGSGSGFIISADGYLVTNHHVIVDPDAEYMVITSDGVEYEAEVVASDEAMDIALLKIEANDLPYLEFGDSDAVQVGQSVVAIGNALGEFSNTVSVGVISGLARDIVASGGGKSEELYDLMQTDAAINSGNSGGPLLDLEGRVVGVNVAASLGMSENIGFALPSNAVKSVVDDLREFGQVQRPYLGVRFTMIDEVFAKKNNLSVDYGALIRRGDAGEVAVVPGSPADKAGFEENDIITEVDGKRLEEALNVVMRKYQPGDHVTFTVLHDGEEKEVRVTLGNQPKSE